MTELVTKDMNIIEIAQKHPESIEIFHKYGLGCLGDVWVALLQDLKILKPVQKFTVLMLMLWLMISMLQSKQMNLKTNYKNQKI